MDYHHHARLTIYSREELAKSVVEGRLSLNSAAAEFKLSRQSASKWVSRFRHGGPAALADRSSRPHRSPRSTPVELTERVERLRRERKTGVQIALLTGLSRPTVSRILTRLKLNKIRMLEPKLPPNRYEHACPGDLLHIDIKKLARIHKPAHRITGNPQDQTRGAGWEFLYVAVDDHSRMAYVAMMPDQKATSASLFLSQAAGYFARHNIQLRRVMTDNGPCFLSDRFKDQCRILNARHIRTRIYTPRTNGKAERFIQTAIREWAYARLYQNSQERNSYLIPWIHQYNWHRPHASLNQMPPISRARLDIDVNNLLRHDNSERNHTFCREQLQAQSIIPAKRRSSCRASGVRLEMRENFPTEQYGKRSLIESVFSAVKRKLSCRAPGRTLHTQSRQAILLGLAFNLYRLWLPAF